MSITELKNGRRRKWQDRMKASSRPGHDAVTGNENRTNGDREEIFLREGSQRKISFGK